MSKNAKRQKLLTIQNDEYGSCYIKRGHDGTGYYYEGEDNTLNCSFCFPVDQSFVAEEFSKKNLEWRFENANS